MNLGHESVLSTWCTSSRYRASRACLQQLARHRHISLLRQVTRWALDKHRSITCRRSLKNLTRKTGNMRLTG